MPNIQQGYQPFPMSLGNPPDCSIGRKAIRVLMDFSLGLTFSLNLSSIQTQGAFDAVQTLYIDNSNNTGAITALMGGDNQSITIPAGAQAYMPVLQTNPPALQFSVTSGTPIVPLQLLNFFVPPCVWYVSGISVTDLTLQSVISNGAVNVNSNPPDASLTDHSGTITTGGTGQVLLAANAARKRLLLQNPSTATEILQYSWHGIAGPWYDLAAGALLDESGSTIAPNAVWVKAATTGHAFTADEG